MRKQISSLRAKRWQPRCVARHLCTNVITVGRFQNLISAGFLRGMWQFVRDRVATLDGWPDQIGEPMMMDIGCKNRKSGQSSALYNLPSSTRMRRMMTTRPSPPAG
jgi:hypothetical protein